MKTALRRMGNSTGIIVPKGLLSELQVECGTVLELKVESGSLIATPLPKSVRAGWADDAALIGEISKDERAWLDISSNGDAELTW